MASSVTENHLITKLGELQRRYKALTTQIAALDTDIGGQIEEFRKQPLRERLAGLVSDRDQIVAEMTSIQSQVTGEDRNAAPVGTESESSPPQSSSASGEPAARQMEKIQGRGEQELQAQSGTSPQPQPDKHLLLWGLAGAALVGLLGSLFYRLIACIVQHRLTEASVALLVFLASGVGLVLIKLLPARLLARLQAFCGGLAFAFALLLVLAAWVLPRQTPENCVASGTCLQPSYHGAAATFDFEERSVKGWAPRDEGAHQLGTAVRVDSGRHCGPSGHSLAFDFTLSGPPLDRSQVKYEADQPVLTEKLSAWVFLPEDAPEDFVAMCFVLEDNRDRRWLQKPDWPWYETPHAALRPGQWTLVECNQNDFVTNYPGGRWQDPLLFGFEFTRSSQASYQGTVYLDNVIVR